MGSLVSKRRKKERHHVTDQDRAVLDLKNCRDRLRRYQTKLDRESGRLQGQALAMVKEGRKDRALLLLKVKKLKQEQATKADSQLLAVMRLMDTIDWETQQLKVFDALKQGNVALKRLHEEMPLEKVEDLMADTADNIAIGEEISKAIGGSWTEANEDDLLAELAEIEREQEEQEMREEQPAPAQDSEKVPPPEQPVEPTMVPESEHASQNDTAGPTPAFTTNSSVTAYTTAEPSYETESARLDEILPEAPTDPIIVPVVESSTGQERAEDDHRPALVPA